LTARISKCVAFAGRAKCAGATAWEWSEAKWPSHTEPRWSLGPKRIQSCYVPYFLFIQVIQLKIIYLFLLFPLTQNYEYNVRNQILLIQRPFF
jgi:hypothetical protein